MTLVELIVVMVIMTLIVTGLANMFVSGERASSDATARLTGQTNVGVAISRLEYEARCATSAALLSSGAGVHLNLPSQCSHASGDISWCVSSGALVRYANATSCTGTAVTLVDGVTSTAPFSCSTATGQLPRLVVSLVVNSTGRSSDAVSTSDTITLRNAATGSTSCS